MDDDVESPWPIVILHISDLHFGDDDQDKLTALRKDIAWNTPDLICITGDVVDLPRKRNFLRAKEFIGSLSGIGKVFVAPGNHDAFFGGPAVRRFRRYLERPLDFASYEPVRGVDICIFGINSTYPSLRHLWNTGKVTKNRLERFRRQVDEMKGKLGNIGYRNAYKIVLLHHHPLPTLSNEAETMLYLKKAGEFLNEMAKQDVNIILHGHQHDPCDFSINYNIGGEYDSMIILSAGTLSKRMPEEKGISKRTHYYVMRLENDKLNVQGMNYHVDSKSFVPNKASVKRIPIDPVARYEVEYTYVVKPNGDLAGEGVAYCKAKPGRRLEDYIFGFGVDGKSPAVTSISDCNLAVTRNGAPMDLAKIVIQKNDPREKLCKVVIDPPITEMEEKITWSYVWKGGWQNLIGKGVDEGGFFIERRTDALRVRFKTGHERLKFKKIEITYENEETVKLLRHAEDQVGFEIENPRKYYTVGYKLEMR